jgi:hypothetical protein
MAELRDIRGRTGAIQWQLGEDISDPDHWVELWWMENWSDHLREAGRLSEQDKTVVARALQFHIAPEPIKQRRYLLITPQRQDV